MLHKLQKEITTQQLRVQIVDTAGGVGGTWYWNRYPGCRCDVPSVEYSFSNDAFQNLEQDWTWSELMAGQPEIERYANKIADDYHLRRHIRLQTKVLCANYVESTGRWNVVTETVTRRKEISSTTYNVKYLITAIGCLSAPNLPQIYKEATTNFHRGPVYHTGKWPSSTSRPEEILVGKRVGVIGTGSSGIQSIPEIAKVAAHLTVFQRTPQYTLPANNRLLDTDYVKTIKRRYEEIRRVERTSLVGISLVPFFGGPLAPPDHPLPLPVRTELLMSLSKEERRRELQLHGFDFIRRFVDVGMDPLANETMCELYREQVKRVVEDPTIAERLSPRGYPLGCKRQVIDTHYFATFNQANVSLIDLRNGGGLSVHSDGITSINSDGKEERHELDVLVFATGFDAMSGPLMKLNVQGKNGLSLSDLWSEKGPETYLGLQIADFPNLFTVTGPGSPSVLSNMICSIEQHVNFIATLIGTMESNHVNSIECTQEAQREWSKAVTARAAPTMLMSPSCKSWYLGSNVEGKRNFCRLSYPRYLLFILLSF